ncbi:ribose 5-phosphate isomerase B [Desulfogranum japonicum]|uniref:ribose 5-phosphate isomerase B n=1 Tax=Desulfogranum japonicum TaxID=231447 RepID=UPI000416110F|nr:ribose 5-phosphate isomerase B [Desulfogranum japonicum]
MRIFIGSDHGGFALKKEVIIFLKEKEIEVVDCGCNSSDSVDYPDFAHKVCQSVLDQKDALGILICGTGIGMSIAANRFKGIRAALCHDAFTAKMSREHNDANILCLGARVLGISVVLDMIDTWLNTAFAGGRHISRLQKMD